MTLPATAVLADGKVIPEVYYPAVEIPNQQAMICHSDGIERLVIETAFIGEGTNFAWVVPLPAPPAIQAVSEDFFKNLQRMFQPRLIYKVQPYYAGVLFVLGLGFLGWRSFKDEAEWINDVPLCLLLGVGAGFLGHHFVFGLVGLAMSLGMRLFIKSSATFAMVWLIGIAFAIILVSSRSIANTYFQTLSTAGDGVEEVAGVTIVSVQHAGVFDSTTIRATNAGAVLEWFDKNGYRTPQSAAPAIRAYLGEGWVFVASKVRRELADKQVYALHPLVFTFAAPWPVYPTRLTAVENGDCLIDLFIFGKQRATARHFAAVRCDRVVSGVQLQAKHPPPGFAISDPELLDFIGSSTVATKLSGKLSPRDMASDVIINAGFFFRKGRTVFSWSAAITIALNLALPMAALSWMGVGASRGGWKVNEKWISRWRWRFLVVSLGVGLSVFLLLPKIEVVSVPPTYGAAAAGRAGPGQLADR